MKKGLVLLFAFTLFFGIVSNVSALTFTDTQQLDVIIGEGPLAQYLSGDTYSYQHNTPADFEVPWDIVNSAALKISGYWIDDNNDQVSVSGTTVGTLNPGGFSETTWSWSTFSWNTSYTPSISEFDISSVFGSWGTGNLLDVSVTANGSFGDGYLQLDTSTFTLDYDNATAPVPEPATLVLLGSGLAGLAFYRRKRK